MITLDAAVESVRRQHRPATRIDKHFKVEARETSAMDWKAFALGCLSCAPFTIAALVLMMQWTASSHDEQYQTAMGAMFERIHQTGYDECKRDLLIGPKAGD